MGYQLPTRSKVEFVSLKISNLNQMVDFYTKVIGLSLIKRTERVAYLGIPSKRKIFISLHKLDTPSKDKNVANMKSFSLILPDQDSFKKSLVHIDNLGIKVSGVQSNEYFDMFHLVDPEGNQVALYIEKFNFHDTDVTKVNWLNLSFKSETLNHYLGGFKAKSEKLPTTTRFGWIDIRVNNLKKSLHFYRDILGLDAQIDTKNKQAVLMTNHDHHRQFVLRQDSNLDPRNTETLGLDYFDIKMFSASEMSQLAKHFSNEDVDCQYSRPNNFIFVSDPDLINITFSLL
ncbi:VOC family protein [Acetilactobacillus jinshanensis]|uniref:VOC domain-containing protein n=1 Tax=Acetilactobacillus jinshanensis TaxID=1720083 RepID=A0A4P6ZMX1_9LACO|nr:VOC family protein [Acetilactobacillus jinshanensis]QBP18782.1 hypothetical protein ELX58_06650 [Acetilactobacillus jinshanensis]